MSREPLHPADARIGEALDELAVLIRRRYPDATFQIAPAEDDPGTIHLLARVDVEDPEEVADVVMARMLQLQVDEGLPIYVIPLRTPERIAAMRAAHPRQPRPRGEYVPVSAP